MLHDPLCLSSLPFYPLGFIPYAGPVPKANNYESNWDIGFITYTMHWPASDRPPFPALYSDRERKHTIPIAGTSWAGFLFDIRFGNWRRSEIQPVLARLISTMLASKTPYSTSLGMSTPQTSAPSYHIASQRSATTANSQDATSFTNPKDSEFRDTKDGMDSVRLVSSDRED